MTDGGPTAGTIAWVRRQLAWARSVRFLRLLPGATSSHLYEIEASDARRTMRFVLRLIDNATWLDECPQIARQEADALTRAAALPIAVPELVAVDPTGASCGSPAVLMGLLEGHVELAPRALDAYLDRLAECLAAVHCIDPTDVRWEYSPWFDVAKVSPPTWSSRPNEWAKAIAAVAATEPVAERSFLHRDLNPTNVLWESGRVSGIVDWPNACVGPRSVDVAHCRVNLAALFGNEAADRFLNTYVRLSDPPLDYDPRWDLSALIETSGEPVLYRPWLEFGAVLSEEEVCRRREELLMSASAMR